MSVQTKRPRLTLPDQIWSLLEQFQAVLIHQSGKRAEEIPLSLVIEGVLQKFAIEHAEEVLSKHGDARSAELSARASALLGHDVRPALGLAPLPDDGRPTERAGAAGTVRRRKRPVQVTAQGRPARAVPGQPQQPVQVRPGASVPAGRPGELDPVTNILGEAGAQYLRERLARGDSFADFHAEVEAWFNGSGTLPSVPPGK